MAIVGITPRVQELGRIRIGDKNDRGLPVSLSTFRFTSADPQLLERARELYGSKDDVGVTPWADAPDAGFYELVTKASVIDIVIPRSLESWTQAWELWQGGACERRCDGVVEEISGQACLCGDRRGLGDDVCDVVTRISVLLPKVGGLGVWRLDTGGYNAAATLPKTIDFLLTLDQRPLVPAVLQLVQRSSKIKVDGKLITRRFVVPVLGAPGLQLESFIEDQLEAGDYAQPEAIPAAVEKPRQTAEERAAARAAEIRSRPSEPVTTGGAGESAGVERSAPAGGVAPPVANGLCGEVPDPDNPLNMKAPCTEPAGHPSKLHKSEEGSWPR